jgi:hypothetical protein
MRLRSFGCSFIYGSELEDRHNTWPALSARKLSLSHVNHGIEGAGNLRILESILTNAASGDLCVINWTWIDRFDFVTLPTEQWSTIVPTNSDSLSKLYYKELHSQYRDMLVNLVYVRTAIDHLRRLGSSFVMTYMDRLLFETVRDDWHPSHALSELQKSIKPYMHDFNGLTFLEWSRANNHAESLMWHPLDTAHAGAADLMLPIIESILHKA